MKHIIYTLVKRLVLSFALLIITVSTIYLLVRLIPGDPITFIYEETVANGDGRKILEKTFGMDTTISNEVVIFIVRIFTGDWGTSIYLHRSVLSIIASRYLNSLILTTLSISLTVFLCIAIGYVDLVVGRHKEVSFISLFSSMPTIIWGVIILVVLAYARIPMVHGSIVPPMITLTLTGLGILYRVFRDSLRSAYDQPYIQKYVALGYSKLRIYMKALRVSMPTILSAILYRSALILTGATAVEKLFSYPGMGQLFWIAFTSRDYPLIVGWGVAVAFTFLAVYAAIDILHRILDPRVATS